MTKILQIVPSLNSINGGVERGTLDIARELIKKGFESEVMSSGGIMAEKYKYKGVNHNEIEINKKGFINLLIVRRKFENMLNEIKPDIVHIRSRWPAFCFNQIAKKNNIITALDNTWGTPLFLKPLEIGFDMSISSATKYFSGHSDVLVGTLAVNKKVFPKVNFYNRVSGYRTSPDDAYLVIRGLRTLDVRLERHEKNTREVIKFLSKQKKIIEILYPHKKGTKNFKNWKKYYKGATGLLGLVIKAKSKNSVFTFVNKLELFGIGYSWGGFESLAVYQDIQREFKKYKDKNLHIVRLHIGLEDPTDLINDLRSALRYVK